MTTALFVAAGYLVGSVPFGYWLVRATKHVDIRTVGSGNIGASNVWRAFGWRYGVAVMLFDLAKGLVPALVATQVAGSLAGVLTGGAAMVGHARPLFLGFAKGGKAVATAGGTILGVAPIVGLIGGRRLDRRLRRSRATRRSRRSSRRAHCRCSPGRSASRGR